MILSILQIVNVSLQIVLVLIKLFSNKRSSK